MSQSQIILSRREMCCNIPTKGEKYIYSLKMKFMAGKRKAHMFHNYLQSLPKSVSNETARVKTTLGGKSSKEPRFGSVVYFTLTAISSIAKHNNPLPGKGSVSRKEYLLAQTPQQHVWLGGLGALCQFPAPPGSSQPPGLQQLLWLHM